MRAPLTLSWPAGVRGAAGPTCCRAAAGAGADHVIVAATGEVWRISCPRHRVRLTSLAGCRILLQDRAARFVREGSALGIGEAHLTGAPLEPALAFAAAMLRTLTGGVPGPAWRARSPRTFFASSSALMDVVLWRRRGIPFAHEFDEIRNTGAAPFSVAAETPGRGAELISDQPPRTRSNVMAALATLLRTPSEAVLPWGLSVGAFDYLIVGMDDLQRGVLARRALAWPDCIATPALQALQKS